MDLINPSDHWLFPVFGRTFEGRWERWRDYFLAFLEDFWIFGMVVRSGSGCFGKFVNKRRPDHLWGSGSVVTLAMEFDAPQGIIEICSTSI